MLSNLQNTPPKYKLLRYLKGFKCYWLLLFFNVVGYGSAAQTLSIGILAGVSNYQGDLASSQWSVITKQTDLAVGGFLNYNFNESFGIKLQILSTELHADDAHSNIDVLQQRNLRFFSPLLDASLRINWFPFEAKSDYIPVIAPYLSLGGSFLSFNPQARYRNQVHELQPLRTEGQGLAFFPDRQPYQLYTGSFLGGIGIKFSVNNDIDIGIELTGQYTFTDYLDDVSSTYADYEELANGVGVLSADIAYQVDDFFDLNQTSPLQDTPRGNPNLNDLFFIVGITLSYKLINPNRAYGGGIGCPTF